MSVLPHDGAHTSSVQACQCDMRGEATMLGAHVHQLTSDIKKYLKQLNEGHNEGASSLSLDRFHTRTFSAAFVSSQSVSPQQHNLFTEEAVGALHTSPC